MTLKTKLTGGFLLITLVAVVIWQNSCRRWSDASGWPSSKSNPPLSPPLTKGGKPPNLP
jgi:hypothetical protein